MNIRTEFVYPPIPAKFFSTYTGQAEPILPGQLFSMTVCN